MTENMYRAALEYLEDEQRRGMAIGSRSEPFKIALAALQNAAEREEQAERDEAALMRGEAVEVIAEVRECHPAPAWFVRRYTPDDSGRPIAILRAVVPLPKPLEIEAEVVADD